MLYCGRAVICRRRAMGSGLASDLKTCCNSEQTVSHIRSSGHFNTSGSKDPPIKDVNSTRPFGALPGNSAELKMVPNKCSRSLRGTRNPNPCSGSLKLYSDNEVAATTIGE